MVGRTGGALEMRRAIRWPERSGWCGSCGAVSQTASRAASDPTWGYYGPCARSFADGLRSSQARKRGPETELRAFHAGNKSRNGAPEGEPAPSVRAPHPVMRLLYEASLGAPFPPSRLRRFGGQALSFLQ